MEENFPHALQVHTPTALTRSPLGELANVKISVTESPRDDVFIKRPLSSSVTPKSTRTRRSRRSHRSIHLPDPVIAKWNLTSLIPLSPHSMLQTLHARYTNGCYYTFAGVALVAFNPFQQIKSLYSIEGMDAYRGFGKDCRESLPPHLFSIAEEALSNMLSGLSANQSIVISGESGAGKTFSARSLMEYFVVASSYQDTVGTHSNEKVRDVADKIVKSNPLLEAFGNASTCRNANSSRFGKYIKLQYDRNGQIVSAEMQTYLMEKTRVTYQAAGEGNYHVFYQVVKGASEEERQRWHLPEGAQYRVLPKLKHVPQYGVRTETDAWRETCNALESVGVSKPTVQNIGELLAALLHLGNLDFSQDVSASDSLKYGAELLGLCPDMLLKTISHRQITAGTSLRAGAAHRESFSKPCEAAECAHRRDAIAKLVYASLFDWLVAYINGSLCSLDHDSQSFIGLLDVYGFENFSRNCLEQLCINYANERLHNLFVQRFIKSQQTEYGAEGLDWTTVDYTDNSACLLAVDGRPGVFAVLDEECHLNRKSDADAVAERLFANIQQANQPAAVSRPPSKLVDEPSFQISHYAGSVVYSTAELVDKNKDNVAADLVDVLTHSSKEFIVSLSTQSPTATLSVTDSPVRSTSSPTPRRHGPKRKTVVAKFKASVDSLLLALGRTTSHYIRCIKPNPSCLPCQFDKNLVMAQLTASSVFETVKISHAGYPVRMQYGEFLSRYECLMRRNQLGKHHRILKVLTPKGTPLLWPQNKRCRSPATPLEQRDGTDHAATAAASAASTQASLTLHTSLSTNAPSSCDGGFPTPTSEQQIAKCLRFNSHSTTTTDDDSVRLHRQAPSTDTPGSHPGSHAAAASAAAAAARRRSIRGTKRRLESQDAYPPDDTVVLMTGEKVRTAALLAGALLGRGDLRCPAAWGDGDKENSPALAEKVSVNSDLQQVACMGHTKVFLKESQLMQLERLRESVRWHSACRLQYWWRCLVRRRHVAASIIQASWHTKRTRRCFLDIRRAAAVIQCMWRSCGVYQRKFHLRSAIVQDPEVIHPPVAVAVAVPASSDGVGNGGSRQAVVATYSVTKAVSWQRPQPFASTASTAGLLANDWRLVHVQRRLATARHLPKHQIRFYYQSSLSGSSVIPIELREPEGLNAFLSLERC